MDSLELLELLLLSNASSKQRLHHFLVANSAGEDNKRQPANLYRIPHRVLSAEAAQSAGAGTIRCNLLGWPSAAAVNMQSLAISASVLLATLPALMTESSFASSVARLSSTLGSCS